MAGLLRDIPEPAKCIQPEISVTLEDCLACSGCVTADEAAALLPDTGFLSVTGSFNVLVLSVHSVRSLSGVFSMGDYGAFERALVAYLKSRFSLSLFVNTSYFSKMEPTDGLAGPLISSECPAVVLYVERIFPTLIPLLSHSMTYLQLAVRFARSRLPDCRVAAVLQCYDKKDEAHRDEMELEYIIGTRELHQVLQQDGFNPAEWDAPLEPWEESYDYRTAEEISGKETVIEALRKIKKGQGGFNGSIELRACRGGCACGPAQVGMGYDDTPARADGKFPMEAPRREFRAPKKRTFQVTW